MYVRRAERIRLDERDMWGERFLYGILILLVVSREWMRSLGKRFGGTLDHLRLAEPRLGALWGPGFCNRLTNTGFMLVLVGIFNSRVTDETPVIAASS